MRSDNSEKTQKDRPKWRAFLDHFGHFLMLLIFLVAVAAPIVLIALFWEEINTVGFTYDFFGVTLPVVTIAFVASAILIPLGAFGLFKCAEFFYKWRKQIHFRLSWKPKIAAVGIVGIAVTAFFYYMPFWYLNLGIKPTFGPYIAYHGENGIQISWDTPTAQYSRLYWGESSNNVNTLATGGRYYWEEDAKTNHHIVVLENLVPGRKYYYRIPSLDRQVYSFTAAPSATSNTKVLFTILGDTQGAFDIQRQNINLMLKKFGRDGLNFTVITGDLVNDDDSLNDWAMLFEHRSYGRISPYIPWMGASGNHECGCIVDSCERRGNMKLFFQNDYASNWDETDKWDVGIYYSFDYSNVHFVVMDNFENGTGTFSEQQLAWLDSDLGQNADKWKFLCFHYSVYSSSEHGSYPKVAAQLEPIMYKHKVNAIFYGHDHIYESYHINATAADYQGTYAFMCSGGGGSLKPVLDPDEMGDRVWNGTLNEKGNPIQYIGAWSPSAIKDVHGAEWQLYAERTHHFMSVEVEGDFATFRAYRTTDGSLIEEHVRVPRL